jgi:hypothetical protein
MFMNAVNCVPCVGCYKMMALSPSPCLLDLAYAHACPSLSPSPFGLGCDLAVDLLFDCGPNIKSDIWLWASIFVLA